MHTQNRPNNTENWFKYVVAWFNDNSTYRHSMILFHHLHILRPRERSSIFISIRQNAFFPRIRRQNMVNVIASYFEVTDFRETHTMYLLSNTNFSLCDNFNWIDCGGSFEWSTWSETKSSGCQLASRLPTEKDEEARSAVRLFVLRSPAGLFPAKPSKFTAYSTNSSSSLVRLENQTNPSCAIIARKSRN